VAPFLFIGTISALGLRVDAEPKDAGLRWINA